MFITKEVNSIMVTYAKKVVLRKLILAFCFESQPYNETISDLLKSVNFHGFDIPHEIELGLIKFLNRFTKTLDKDELTALSFWVLNQKYRTYIENFECDDDNYSEKEFYWRFGRNLAYKIYAPNDSGLEYDTVQELKLLLCNFASELDLSLKDEYTSMHILEMIDVYCSSSKNLQVVI